MLFNSIDFAIFLPLVFILYWLINKKHLRFQNIFLLIASYIFYSWWDWRFLSLIIFSTVVDYSVGISLSYKKNLLTRKLLLITSLVVNLGFLGFFKYYNFFIDNFREAFSFFGGEFNANSLRIVLPVGISFYTFQTLSYTIDVYRQKIKPTKSFIAFAAYVSFFPQLVAGPIERATNLLPQFLNKRKFDYNKAINGMRQILWGLFKKIVIADSCAVYVNDIFANYSIHSGSTLVLGAILFAFQIYGDFSGYSDIAIGTARLFGFNLMRNFAFPYFSRDIAEFWRRWHISLSTWFRDYLYIPLGGSRGNTANKIRNIFIIFIVSGFWHGANWTFIVWGALNAIYFLPLLLLNQNRKNLEIVAKNRLLPSLKDFFSILMTFGLTVLAWVFFRSENVINAIEYINGIFSSSFFTIPELDSKALVFYIFVFIIIEWFGRHDDYAIDKLVLKWPVYIRYGFYYFIIFAILNYFGNQQEFIYFQF